MQPGFPSIIPPSSCSPSLRREARAREWGSAAPLHAALRRVVRSLVVQSDGNDLLE